MAEPSIRSEALACYQLTRDSLRSRYVALHPDVYVPRDTDLAAESRACAAWLWSRHRGIVAGRSASAVHGATWVSGRASAQLLLYNYRRPPQNIEAWSDLCAEDEIETRVECATVAKNSQ